MTWADELDQLHDSVLNTDIGFGATISLQTHGTDGSIAAFNSATMQWDTPRDNHTVSLAADAGEVVTFTNSKGRNVEQRPYGIRVSDTTALDQHVNDLRVVDGSVVWDVVSLERDGDAKYVRLICQRLASSKGDL